CLQLYPAPCAVPSFPTRRSSDLLCRLGVDLVSWLQGDRKCAVSHSACPPNYVLKALRFTECLGGMDDETQVISCQEFPEHCRLRDRKSTRLNSSHVKHSYAVFCL